MPLNTEILEAHLNSTFVETGTYRSEGVVAALAAGFGRVWTVDLDSDHRWDNGGAPEANPNVTYETGDSALLLADMLPNLRTPATFWLDAHPTGYFKLLQPDLPLVNELLAMSFTPRDPRDILLIDDIRLFDAADQARLNHFIRLLWPRCVLDLIDSSIIPKDNLRVTNLA